MRLPAGAGCRVGLDRSDVSRGQHVDRSVGECYSPKSLVPSLDIGMAMGTEAVIDVLAAPSKFLLEGYDRVVFCAMVE